MIPMQRNLRSVFETPEIEKHYELEKSETKYPYGLLTYEAEDFDCFDCTASKSCFRACVIFQTPSLSNQCSQNRNVKKVCDGLNCSIRFENLYQFCNYLLGY